MLHQVETLISWFALASEPNVIYVVYVRLSLLRGYMFCVQKMSSLVERLRIRSDRKPVYNLDDSDDDDFVPKKDRTLEHVEAIVRTDAVCSSS